MRGCPPHVVRPDICTYGDRGPGGWLVARLAGGRRAPGDVRRAKV